MSLHTDTEKANEAEFGGVDPDGELLESFGVRASLSVDAGLEDVEQVVPEDSVECCEGYGCKPEG